MIVLDGRALARRREPLTAARSAAVRAARGRAPTLLLAAFADEHGSVPHVSGKLRAAERVGVRVEPIVFQPSVATHAAVQGLAEGVRTHSPDAVFVQVPCPAGVDAAALLAAIPAELDVDIMSPSCARDYLGGKADLPPVTITGALELLDAGNVSVQARRGFVIAEPSDYSRMIVEAFRRRGASMDDPLPPGSRELSSCVSKGELVVAAAASPGTIRSDNLRHGCIALDFGYFNAGGHGDIDTTPGTAHLEALMPVPGGVGPMTVSALLERVVAFAER